MKIIIEGKPISYKDNPFIIAEAGVNHNGNLNLALKLVDAAANAGADAVKFQTFKANQVVINNTEMAEYQKRNTKITQNQQEMLKKIELKENFYYPIIHRCKKRKITFLSTPHGGFESIKFLQKLNIPAIKFGSGDLTNFPVLEYAAKLGLPIILSTGMATLKEVRRAINVIKKTHNKKIIVLQATTNYPCPLNEVNLNAMRAMMKKLDVLIGLSDHTLDIEVPIMAATLGACVIEKHFTLDKKLPGPDHKASLDPHELKNMVNKIKNIKTILGSFIKKPSNSELKMMRVVRKSIVSLSSIKKGELLTTNNIGIKRPGNGIQPRYYYKILGKKASVNIKADELIQRRYYDK
ncbi:MAG: N-acetylneuraminate synthase [Patescibacteria group bacterium]|nr:N-acetylneuraminate synthase [Patescibacteria group bacterium]MDD5715137.1 N-acetylneuraminate synthase [Patescibacteria group bacterium]